MELLRRRLPAASIAALTAMAISACGDGDGSGAAEDIDKAKDKIEREGKKLQRDVEREGSELRDDVEGKDEKQQKKKKRD